MFKLFSGLLILFSSSAQLINNNPIPSVIKCPIGQVQIKTLFASGYGSKNTYDSTCELAVAHADIEFQIKKRNENEACLASRGQSIWGEIDYMPGQNRCKTVGYRGDPRFFTYDHEINQTGICCRSNYLYQNQPIINLTTPTDFCKFHFGESSYALFYQGIFRSHIADTCPDAISGAIRKLNQASSNEEQNCWSVGGKYKLYNIFIVPLCSSQYFSLDLPHKTMMNTASAKALCCKRPKIINNTNEYGGEIPELETDLELDTEIIEKFQSNNNDIVNNGSNTTYQTVPFVDVVQMFEDAKSRYIIDNNNLDNITDVNNSDTISFDYINYLLFFASCFLFIINY
jgi:hypothetical protein